MIGPVCASSEDHRYLRNWKDVFSKRFEAIPLSHMASEKVLRGLQMLYVRFGYPLHDSYGQCHDTSGHRRCKRLSSRPASDSPSRCPPFHSPTPWKGLTATCNTMSRVLCHQHCCRLGGSATCRTPCPPQRCPRETGSHSIRPGREPATPLDLVSKVPGTPLAANTYVRRLEDHQFRAHRAVQVQLALALQRTSRRYGNERDAIQPEEKVWLFTSRPSADRKLAIPYSGPCRVTKRLSGMHRTIRP